ncbi:MULTISPECIES: DUF6232 family protein [Vitreoscilla]|uniref:Uncharacterized protein n=1 Tax=Vitreoscilla stercoraria TaxID=61 RepID=A0ABY4EB15_VITST|nr:MULTISPECIES: hypothetical protein [Vitreoscilla]AUZ05638.1 hypothetical protein ADP71_22500 [Vitreoscilla sp. C1]UOO92949.1 hypothetical protein LVJ81_02600 [Vitreoscilla stercoraria]
MELEKLNASLAKYDVQFDAVAMTVAGARYPYADIASIHYLKPKKRALIRFLTTLATVALAAWIVLASQHQSESIKLAVGILIGLTIARFYMLGKVFPKLSVTLKNGDKVEVMKKFDLIAADRIYAQLVYQMQTDSLKK